jgi:hypothetical protein
MVDPFTQEKSRRFLAGPALFCGSNDLELEVIG